MGNPAALMVIVFHHIVLMVFVAILPVQAVLVRHAERSLQPESATAVMLTAHPRIPITIVLLLLATMLLF